PDAAIVFDHLAREAIAERHALILDHYEARTKQPAAGMGEAVPYKPTRPETLYLSPDEVAARAGERLTVDLTPFDAPDVTGKALRHAGAHAGRSFAEERADPNANVFDHAVKHIADMRAGGRRVLVAGFSEGSLDRLTQVLE